MTLATSGTLSSDDLLAELRLANPNRNYPLGLLDTDVLALAGKSGPPVTMPGDFYGKSVSSGGGGGGGGGGTPSTLAASMSDADGSAISGSSSAFVANVPISISVSGGQSPYSYAWSKLSGTGFVQAANAPTTAGQFNVPAHAQAGLSYSEVAQCIVTDALGATVTCSANVTLTID